MADATEPTERGPYTGKWFDERNTRRRALYATDPAYRSKANGAARDSYRKQVGMAVPPDPSENMRMLDHGPTCAGRLRVVKGRGRRQIMFTKKELALIFGRPAKQVQQWAASNDTRIPSPLLKARVEGEEKVWLDCYTMAEARAIVTSLTPFIKDLFYLRSDHREAIDACRDAVTSVRKAMNYRA